MADVQESQKEADQRHYVFFCVGCRTIFGDSFATVRMNKHLKSISLNAVTDAVRKTKECETSADGEDKGSTYHILECKSCHRAIGRMYETTPRKLDPIRDLYTLEWSRVKSYQLGNGTNANIKPEIQDADLLMHSMLLNLTERVKKLEALVEEVDDEDDADETELQPNRNEKKRKIR